MDSGKNSYLIRRLLNRSLTVVYCLPCRISDALFHAMLLWYYSTLTLQEHILIANGSRCKSLLPFVYIHISLKKVSKVNMCCLWTQFRLYHEALIRNITITPEQDISSMLSVLIDKPAALGMIKWSQVCCLRKQCNLKVWTEIFRSEVWGVNHLAVTFICKLAQHSDFYYVFVWRSYVFGCVTCYLGMTIINTKIPIVSLLLGKMTLKACYYTVHPQVACNEL